MTATEPVKGQRLGPYRIERLLGRGGMGAVYLASRVDDFEMRRVALKVISHGSRELARRFHHERQILAHLDHPNIAKLLDGGTTEEGIPYFVMDYVEGEPIDRYCDQNRLGIRQRLELFHKVCSAVQVAHKNLVVHRDIKPGNIMVGADGEPKLLDFGIAKPLDTPDSPATVLTSSGMRPMTLKYASPEQVGGDQVTTASDIYSLGVVLYELLTGCWPYPTSSNQWLDLANAIQYLQPQKPRTVIDLVLPGPGPGETLAPQTLEMLQHRDAVHSDELRRRLAGDLDCILLTALNKAPERRYSSVEQLSADIRLHLEGLPIDARKYTFKYWAGKFIQRHKIETAMAALLLAALVGFSAVTWHLKNEAVRLKDQAIQLKDEAVLERQHSEEVSDFLVELFMAPDPDKAKGEAITARDILERGKGQIQELRGSQPRLYARLASTMGEVYYNLGLYEDAEILLEDALANTREDLGSGADPLLATLSNDLAAVLWALGDFPGAEKRFRETLRMKIQLYGQEGAEIVDTLNNLGTLAKERGAYEEAEVHFRKGLAIRQKLEPPAPEEVASSFFHLGTLFLEKGDYEGAERMLEPALDMQIDQRGFKHTRVAVVLNNLGIALQALGRGAESEERYRDALEIRRALLGEQHQLVAATETQLASLLITLKRFEDAEELARKALETLRTKTPGHWRIAYAQSILGSCLAGQGRFEDAEPLLLASYRDLLKVKRECTPYTLDALRRMINFYDLWRQPTRGDDYRAELSRCDHTGR